MSTLYATTTLVTYQCWCGIHFALPESLYKEFARKNDLAPHSFNIHCPMGHSMTTGVSNALTEAQAALKAKTDELARSRAALDQSRERAVRLQGEVEHQERRVNGYKGVVARTKRRVSKGVCPCCSRKFKDLKEHMQTQHPSWNPDRAAEITAEKSSDVAP